MVNTELLKEFDRRAIWKSLSYYAEKYGVSRQRVQQILMAHRREKYLKLRRPQGKRNDLLGRK